MSRKIINHRLGDIHTSHQRGLKSIFTAARKALYFIEILSEFTNQEACKFQYVSYTAAQTSKFLDKFKLGAISLEVDGASGYSGSGNLIF